MDDAAKAAAIFGGTTPTQPARQTQPVRTVELSQAERLFGKDGGIKPEPYEDVFSKAIREEKERTQPQAQPKATQHDAQVAQDIGQAMEGILQEQGLVADQHSDALAEFLKTNNLGVDQAKALTELHRARVQEQEDQQFAAWHEASMKEFRHADLAPAKELLANHADDELLQLLDNTGAGSHPAVIRFLKRLADAW